MRLTNFLALALTSLAVFISTGFAAPSASPVATPQSPCVCEGQDSFRFAPHECIDLLWLTTHISEGQCAVIGCDEQPCEAFYAVYVEFDSFCWLDVDDVSIAEFVLMDCASDLFIIFTLGNDYVAHAHFTCYPCEWDDEPNWTLDFIEEGLLDADGDGAPVEPTSD